MATDTISSVRDDERDAVRTALKNLLPSSYAHVFALVATRDKPGGNIARTQPTIDDARNHAVEDAFDALDWMYQLEAHPNVGDWTVTYDFTPDHEWYEKYMMGYDGWVALERFGEFYGYDQRDIAFKRETTSKTGGQPTALLSARWVADSFDELDVSVTDLAYLGFVYCAIAPTEDRLFEAIEEGKHRVETLRAVASQLDLAQLHTSLDKTLDYRRTWWEDHLAYDEAEWEKKL